MKFQTLDTDLTKPEIYYNHVSSKTAYERIRAGDKDPRLVDIVADDPYYAYLYAYYEINGRWQKGEKAIASSPCFAYYYAYNVIKGRFPEGEKMIAKDTLYARLYAQLIK